MRAEGLILENIVCPDLSTKFYSTNVCFCETFQTYVSSGMKLTQTTPSRRLDSSKLYTEWILGAIMYIHQMMSDF